MIVDLSSLSCHSGEAWVPAFSFFLLSFVAIYYTSSLCRIICIFATVMIDGFFLNHIRHLFLLLKFLLSYCVISHLLYNESCVKKIVIISIMRLSIWYMIQKKVSVLILRIYFIHERLLLKTTTTIHTIHIQLLFGQGITSKIIMVELSQSFGHKTTKILQKRTIKHVFMAFKSNNKYENLSNIQAINEGWI